MSVTLRDVAAKVNLSVSTVSAVLNDRPNTWASAENRRRILRAADELGYRPHTAARALRNGRTHNVALVYIRPSESLGAVSHYSAVTEVLANFLQPLSYRLLVQPLADQGRALVHLEHLARTRACDLVLLWGEEGQVEEQAELLGRLGTPFVAKGRFERSHPEWPQFEFDHEAMVTALVRRLSDGGRRPRVAFVTLSGSYSYLRRLHDAYEAAVRDLTGAAPDPGLCWIDPQAGRPAENAALWAERLHRLRPDSVLIATGADYTWQGVERGLARLGRRIGPGRDADEVPVEGLCAAPLRLLFGEAHYFRVDYGGLTDSLCRGAVAPLLRGGAPPSLLRYLPELEPAESLRLLDGEVRLAAAAPP